METSESRVSDCKVHATVGEARIKPEFLIHDHVRTINLEFVDDQDKLKLEKEKSDGSEPRRKKFKGRNKQRQKMNRPWVSCEQRLCLSVVRGLSSCPSSLNECGFLHDVETFVANKKPDIGDRCHLYDTFGECRYGVTCRFASQHLTNDFKNIVNEEVVSRIGAKATTKNNLSKELQMMLRKRQYNFELANRVVSSLSEFLSWRHECLKSRSKDDHWCADVRCYLEHQTKTTDLESALKTMGTIDDTDGVRGRFVERKKIDFAGKLYLAPLTTVGNLPFRRICKQFGADITCGEMAMVQNLLQGQPSEWALLKRHESEDLFGVQLCGAHADQMTRCAQLLVDNIDVDFVDINVGCPIDLIYRKGAGSALMDRTRKFEEIVYGMQSVMSVPLTAKIRMGIHEKKNTAHLLVPKLRDWGIDLITMHGRSREQRYTKLANWDYIDECAKAADPLPLFGCGDVVSYDEYHCRLSETSVSGVMIGRGALMKPWIFKEIKEQCHLDISSSERLDILRDFVHYGLEHWGSDSQGVENTRRFLLEWLSFLYRYIPVGLLERVPQKINERPPYYRGRDDLETLMASPYCADWIKISEMLLGPVPSGFTFLPKHKANSFS